MMNDMANRLAWGKEVKKNQLLYPDERVVSFLAINYPDITANYQRKALDIGFGSGRHLQLLLNYGFQTYGIDYAQEALNIAHSLWKDTLNLKDLKTADLNEKPYPDNFFDVILYWGVSFFRPVEEMQKDLLLVSSLLKNGGRLLVNFRTKDNWFFGKGKAISADTYLLDHSASSYNGLRYTFLDFDQASNLLSQANFDIDNSERIDLWKRNRSEHHSWWIFWARKEK